MCFSATASFAASGALTAVGVATLAKADKQERLVALVPFLFAVQQFIEGLQWIVSRAGSPSVCLGYDYLFFAFVLWPLYIPFAIHQFERDARRKKMLRWFIVIGAIVSLVMLFGLVTRSLSVHILPYGIEYLILLPSGGLAQAVAYIVVTCGSFFCSSRASVRILGAAVVVSAIFASAISLSTFFSTWCFFAAILSLLLYLIVGTESTRVPSP